MKKLLTLMIAAAVVFTGCDKKSDDDGNGNGNGSGNGNGNGSQDAALSIDKATIDASASGGNYTIAITSSGTWAATVNADATAWCNLSAASATGNKTVTVTVSANPASTQRTATITFSAGTLTKQAAVTQAADNSALRIDPATVPASYTAGTYTLNVTATQAWSAEVNAAATWCAISPNSYAGSREVTVSVAAQPVAAQRAATITFTAGTLTKAVTVSQAAAPATLTTDKTSIDVYFTTGSYTVAVTSNATWTAMVNSGATWCTASPASGTGDGTVTVNVTENAASVTRSATLTFAAGTATKIVSITQRASAFYYATDAPTYAASNKVWVIAEQYWSDAIHVIPECNKTSFGSSTDYPRCRSYSSGINTWYYYNWIYVNQNGALLCPSPWRVPDRSDFCNLDKTLFGTTNCEWRTAQPSDVVAAAYINMWGGNAGGYAYSTSFINEAPEQYTSLLYWSRNNYSGFAYAYNLRVEAKTDNLSTVSPDGYSNMGLGFQVRCVK